MAFEPAFKTKLRITENKSPKGDNPPEKRLMCDFSVKDAHKAADWLIQRAKQASSEGETIRIYTSKEDYTEESGFTMWGGFWGNSGSIAPAPIDTSNGEEAL